MLLTELYHDLFILYSTFNGFEDGISATYYTFLNEAVSKAKVYREV